MEDGNQCSDTNKQTTLIGRITSPKRYLPNPQSKHRFVHQEPRKQQKTYFHHDDKWQHHVKVVLSESKHVYLLCQFLQHHVRTPAPRNISESVFQSVTVPIPPYEWPHISVTKYCRAENLSLIQRCVFWFMFMTVSDWVRWFMFPVVAVRQFFKKIIL